MPNENDVYHIYAPQDEQAETESDRAIKDRLGNVIDETYATKQEVPTDYATIEYVDNSVADKMHVIMLPKGNVDSSNANHYYGNAAILASADFKANPSKYIFVHAKANNYVDVAVLRFQSDTGSSLNFFCNNGSNAMVMWASSNGRFDIWYEKYEYQEKLVSGTSIKTINNRSILGSGNLDLPTFDEELSLTASGTSYSITNPKKTGVFKLIRNNGTTNVAAGIAIISYNALAFVNAYAFIFDNATSSSRSPMPMFRQAASADVSSITFNRLGYIMPTYTTESGADISYWDTTPTKNSVKAVTSGGIYDAINDNPRLFDGMISLNYRGGVNYYMTSEDATKFVKSFVFDGQLKIYKINYGMSGFTFAVCSSYQSSSGYTIYISIFTQENIRYVATISVATPITSETVISETTFAPESKIGIGSQMHLNGTNTIVIGNYAGTTVSNSTITIGYYASSQAGYTVTIGDHANASASESIAIGHNAVASNSTTEAIGCGARATGVCSTAFGHEAIAAASESIAIGCYAKSYVAYGVSFDYTGSDHQRTIGLYDPSHIFFRYAPVNSSYSSWSQYPNGKSLQTLLDEKQNAIQYSATDATKLLSVNNDGTAMVWATDYAAMLPVTLEYSSGLTLTNDQMRLAMLGKLAITYNANGPVIPCKYSSGDLTNGIVLDGYATSAADAGTSASIPRYYNIYRRVRINVSSAGVVSLGFPSPYYSDLNSLYCDTDLQNFESTVTNSNKVPLSKAIYGKILPSHSSSDAGKVVTIDANDNVVLVAPESILRFATNAEIDALDYESPRLSQTMVDILEGSY